MRLYTSGVKVPKLGSLQDRVIRQHFNSEAEKETKKVQLLALLAANSVQYSDKEASTKWENKVRAIWNKYLELEYGIEIPEHTENEIKMMEYYNNSIKNLKAKLSIKDGKLTLFGVKEKL